MEDTRKERAAQAVRDGRAPEGVTGPEMDAAEGRDSTRPTVSTPPAVSSKLDTLKLQEKLLTDILNRYAMPTEAHDSIRDTLHRVCRARRLEEIRITVTAEGENHGYLADLLAICAFNTVCFSKVARTPGETFLIFEITPGTCIENLVGDLESIDAMFEVDQRFDNGTLRVMV